MQPRSHVHPPPPIKDPESARLVLFARLPEPGHCKTRVAKALGPDLACRLYTAFVEDMLEGLDALAAPVTVAFDPPSATEAMEAWLGASRRYSAQKGGDLGERMATAFDEAFEEPGVDRVLLVGSDIPDFPPALLGAALDSLLRVPALVGPAQDGGYYAVGFSRAGYRPGVFKGVPWSTARTLDVTMERFREAGVEPALLPEWPDVDTVRDVNALWRTNANSSFAQSRTYAILEAHAEELARYDLDPALSIGPDGESPE